MCVPHNLEFSVDNLKLAWFRLLLMPENKIKHNQKHNKMDYQTSMATDKMIKKEERSPETEDRTTKLLHVSNKETKQTHQT